MNEVKEIAYSYIDKNINSLYYIISPYFLVMQYDFFLKEERHNNLGISSIVVSDIELAKLTISEMIDTNTPFLICAHFNNSLIFKNGDITCKRLIHIKEIYDQALSFYDDPVIKTNYGIYKVMNSI